MTDVPATTFHFIELDHPVRLELMTDIEGDHVLLGLASEVHYRPGMELEGMLFTSLHGSWVRTRREETNARGAVAVPMGHPLLDINRALAEYNNPGVEFPWMAPESPTSLFVPTRPLPSNLPPIPEGCRLLGWGRSNFSPTLSPGYILRGDDESSPDRWEYGDWYVPDETCIFAYPADSSLALAHPDVVTYYQNLLEIRDMEPIATFRALPQGIPPCPEGLVIVGHGDTYSNPPEGQLHAYYNGRNWSSTRSSGRLITGNACRYEVHAYAPDSPTALALAEAVAFYNPDFRPVTSTPSAIGLEPWMSPPPDGMVYLGRGGTFLQQGPFHGRYNNPTISRWFVGNHCSGRDDYFYAVDQDSPLIALNQLAPRKADPLPYGERQWLLTLNGTPVASLSELENLCSALISKPEHLTPLTDCLWRALEYDDPEAHLGDWPHREALLLMVDFLPNRSENGALMPAVIESSKSIGEIITTAAAGVLLRGGLSNHFRYTEEGRLVINPASPPSIDQGCEILRRTLEVRETGQKLDNYSAWTLGMLGDELERFFGDDFDPSLVMQATGRAYNTYITSLKVYRELWADRRNLSFTHHKEALYAKVAPEDTTFILDTADRLRLSVAQQRKLTSFVRLYGSSSFDEEPPEEAEALMERLEVKSVNKNYLFFLRSENKWFRYRGPFEHIPNGATTIINADTRAMLDASGQPTEMAEWTPVGVEMPYVRGHSATLEAHRAEALPGDNEVEPSHGGNTDRLDSVDEERIIDSLVSQVIINQIGATLQECSSDGSAMVDLRAPEILEELVSTQEFKPPTGDEAELIQAILPPSQSDIEATRILRRMRQAALGLTPQQQAANDLREALS